MIYQLRIQSDELIVDIEIIEKEKLIDVIIFIDIEKYSELLLKAENKPEIISDFSNLQKNAGLKYSETIEKDISIIYNKMKQYLMTLANKYNLMFVYD